jgi:hypothetical protein
MHSVVFFFKDMMHIFLAEVDVLEGISSSRSFFASVPLIRRRYCVRSGIAGTKADSAHVCCYQRLESSASLDTVEPEYAGWLPTAGQIGVDGVATHEGRVSWGWQLSLPQDFKL